MNEFTKYTKEAGEIFCVLCNLWFFFFSLMKNLWRAWARNAVLSHSNSVLSLLRLEMMMKSRVCRQNKLG